MRRIAPLPFLALLVFCLNAGAGVLQAGEVQPSRVKYYDDIKPIFSIHCYKCHSQQVAKGKLRLDLRDSAFGEAQFGAIAIVPSDSNGSEILRRITSHDPQVMMPKKGERLSEAEIDLVRRWIEQGAQWPHKDDYWAFTPPTEPAVPVVNNVASANPIDAFIDARLEAEKIAPQPRADSRTLLRRSYADLLGVPPSPEEADAFLNDKSPDAFAKLVDRLLADRRYGQRWARHWLDLVRYSESDGFEDDKIRPRAWRYRDYVIRSFNADKPYDCFVQEQIAGDELDPDDVDAWIATGFARLGMWDGMSKDPPRQRQDFLNDATDAVGSVFLGVTIGCARCHDHKYDAIKQRDYYALQAFFANITRGNHQLSGDVHDPPQVMAALHQARNELAKLHAARDAIMAEARDQTEWEHRCEVDENAKVLITDKQIAETAERLHPKRIGEIDSNIKQWERIEQLNSPVAEVIYETSAQSPKTFLLEGGELSRVGPQVQPAFVEAMVHDNAALSIAPAANGKSSGRRTALAHWLTSRENPLLARVMVNRLWQHHFGRGIVATPSDFGRHGQPPTHPELLDWLACRFMSDGWSIKRMHRLMMTSAAYQRASTFDSEASARDPQNKLLWRANRQRLDAEAIRDSMLAVSGQLSDVAGGPGVYPRISKEINVELPNNDKELSWGTSSDEEDRRRSIYIFQRRSLTFPLVEVFDGATMSQTCPVRAQTTVAPQALALLNGDFCRAQAKHLAQRVSREVGPDNEARVKRVFVLALTRQPTSDELSETAAYLKKQAEIYRNARHASEPDADLAAFSDFCQVILNTNEFLFLD